MTRRMIVVQALLGFLLLAGAMKAGAGQQLPVIDGKEVVATINGEPLTLEEFNKSIAWVHQQAAGEKKPGAIDYSAPLQRQINAKLILLEAKSMDFYELKEIKETTAAYSEELLVGQLLQQRSKDVKPDEAVVESRFRAMVKEVKLYSLIFDDEKSARDAATQLAKSEDFLAAAKQLVQEKKAEGELDGNYTKCMFLLPKVAETVEQMNIGAISPVIPVKTRFTIFKLDDVRYPENQMMKDQMLQEAQKEKATQAVSDYLEELKKREVKIDAAVLDGLDYEASSPTVDALREDQRVIAEIAGDHPITVGDLTKELAKGLYHASESGQEGKKFNAKKQAAFREMLQKQLFLKEARSLGLDKAEAFQETLKNYENNLVFDEFIKRVILPDITIKEDEEKKYYHEHAADFATPEMLMLHSLAFAQAGDAASAVEKLSKGTQFSWLKANTEGQLSQDAEGMLNLTGSVYVKSSLPQAVQKLLSGAKDGDAKTYADPAGHAYVIYVQQVYPAAAKQFDTVKDDIRKELLQIKANKAIQDYAEKLRKVYKVVVYAPDAAK